MATLSQYTTVVCHRYVIHLQNDVDLTYTLMADSSSLHFPETCVLVLKDSGICVESYHKPLVLAVSIIS